MLNIVVCKSQKEIIQALKIRSTVFILEQNVDPDIELDEEDLTATHILAYQDDVPVGVCRILYPENEDYSIIGRLAVLKECRHLHYGKDLMNFAEEEIRKSDRKKIMLHGQTHALTFYEELGYHTEGELFYEANIPHYTMVKDL